MPAKPKTVDEYLARVNDVQQAALEKLRRDIKAAAPAAEECISYGIPSYRLGSKLLVSFGAAKRHCAFYAGAHPIRAHRQELTGYDLAIPVAAQMLKSERHSTVTPRISAPTRLIRWRKL